MTSAEEARRIQERLGNPSTQDFISLIENGAIMNLPISRDDILRAEDIYGPCPQSLRGKTKLRPVPAAKLSTPSSADPIILHIDLMYVEKSPYLVSVGSPMPVTLVTNLGGSQSAAPVAKALQDHLNVYRAARKDIFAILTDGEGAVAKLRPRLMERGILVNTCGAGGHVPIVERRIQVIKERVRGIISTLPFTLPHSLPKHLISFSVSRLNLIPSNTHYSSMSPREYITSSKTDYNRDVRITFGEYVEVSNPTIAQRNSMAPRTDPAIVLYPTGNSQGSVWFYSLRTGGIISRDHWTSLPMPQSIIDRLNSMAASETHKTPADPQFSIGNTVVDTIYEAQPFLQDPQASTPPDLITGLADDNSPADNVQNTPIDLASQQDETADHGSELQPDALPSPEQVAPPQFDSPEVSSQNSSNKPYDLRVNRSYGHIDGDWRNREPDSQKYGFHLTLKRATATYGDVVQQSLDDEVHNMERYRAFEPVHYHTLTPQQHRKILRTSSLLKKSSLATGNYRSYERDLLWEEMDRIVRFTQTSPRQPFRPMLYL